MQKNVHAICGHLFHSIDKYVCKNCFANPPRKTRNASKEKAVITRVKGSDRSSAHVLMSYGRRKTQNPPEKNPPLKKREANTPSFPNKTDKKSSTMAELITNRRALSSALKN